MNYSGESDQASAHFGFSVSTAGDVNGDGFSDVLVGANYFDNGQSDEGLAYLYLGSSSGLEPTPAWTLESNQANVRFGFSVNTAGDINGDGFSDVIIGSFASRADVYLGSNSGLSTTPAWTTLSSGQFGSSVSTAGDVNGDGYSDVLVGAILFTNTEFQEGRTYLYYGSPDGLSTTPRWTNAFNQASAWYGVAVSNAGDVNADGFGDVLIGAHLFDNGQTNEGLVELYLGSTTGLEATPAWRQEGNRANAFFGASLKTAGDVNADGYSDVIIGAYGFTNGESNEGAAFLYEGTSSGLGTVPAWSMEGNQAESYLGWSVGTAGDVNSDGYSDVLVGALQYDNGAAREGTALLFLGSSNGLAESADWSARGQQIGAEYGSSVNAAGDVNGDGYGDVIIGAQSYTNAFNAEGRTDVYHGSQFGLSATPAWTIYGGQENAQLGKAVASAGDVNGDGYSDVIVGALLYDNGQVDEGKAWVYHGSPTGLVSTPAWSGESNQANAWYSNSLGSIGDVNGDGYTDIYVGAHYYDNFQIDKGRVFVHYGSSTGLPSNSSWEAENSQGSAWFGLSASTAGDVNGDGYDDLLVGAPRFDNGSFDEGGVFLYYGNNNGGLTVAPLQHNHTQRTMQTGGLTDLETFFPVLHARVPAGRAL